MELLWRIVPAVRTGERERFLLFGALHAALGLTLTVGLTAAESLFLSRFGADALPATFVVASLVTTAASFLYAIRLGQAHNDRVFAELLAISALAAAPLAAAAWAQVAFASTALLCLQIAAQAILSNHLSELTGDCFDRLASKRVTPLFTAALSLGAAGGGALAVALSRRLPAEALATAWTLLLLMQLAGVLAARSRIRRWSPLGLEEDVRSLDGVRAAARHLRSTRLGRLLVLSAVLLVASGTVLRYLYSDVLVREFPEPRALAEFLGAYLALTNLAQIVIPLWIAPWLVLRLGVPTANLVHPLLSLCSSIGLAVSQHLPAAIGARLTAELADTTFAGPVRGLVASALPDRLSARAGAFLSGVVVQLALSAAGAALLVAQRFDLLDLAAIAALFSLLYLAAHVRMRPAYVGSLVDELRAGRLDLAAIGGELGRGEVSRLALLWEQLVGSPDPRSLRMLAELAPFLAARGIHAPLLEALSHPNPELRAASLDALATVADARASIPRERLEAALGDDDVRVRRAALRTLPGSRAEDATFGAALRRLLDDPAADVAAEAASRLGPEGEAALARMAAAADPARATEALRRLPETLAALAVGRLDDEAPAVRAAALACAARHPQAFEDETPRFAVALSDPEVSVRAAAAAALAASPASIADALLAASLGDPAAGVRRIAVLALSARGVRGERAALARLGPTEPCIARENALDAIHRIGSPESRAIVAREFLLSVRQAWTALLALPKIPEAGPLALRWLRAAECDALASALRLAFRILTLVEDPAVARTVERTLRFGPERLRYEALEVLANLGERDAAGKLVLLLEPSPLEDKLQGLGGFAKAPRDLDDVIGEAREGATRWLRLAAGAQEKAMAPKEGLMERLVFLRGVSLFSNLDLDQLEAVERIGREEPFVAGERIVREGDPGEHLYLLMEGEVSVWKDLDGGSPRRLNVLRPGSYFGEMSILDHEPRSASVVANEASRLLVLDGDRLHELILERPEIAFEIFRVLTSRVRAAEARLAG